MNRQLRLRTSIRLLGVFFFARGLGSPSADGAARQRDEPVRSPARAADVRTLGRYRILRTAVVTVLVMGMPLPSSAAGEEEVGVPRHRGLTINGRPLSQLLNATVVARDAFPLAGLLEQGSGQILGLALDTAGHPLADHAVELRSVSEQGEPSAPVVATTTTDANGRFFFPGLGRGRYTVALRFDERVIATSGPIALAEGGMAFTQVGGVAAEPSTTDDRKGRGGLFWTAVGAGAGGALGLVAIAGADDCGNLCPLVPVFTTMTGALMGLLFGL